MQHTMYLQQGQQFQNKWPGCSKIMSPNHMLLSGGTRKIAELNKLIQRLILHPGCEGLSLDSLCLHEPRRNLDL